MPKSCWGVYKVSQSFRPTFISTCRNPSFMNLEHLVLLMHSEGFASSIDRDSSKKLFQMAYDYLRRFYGSYEPQNREKDMIVLLTGMIECLKISDDKKEAYYSTYSKIADKFGLPAFDYSKMKLDINSS